MRSADKLVIARYLIERWAPDVKAKGRYQQATGLQPSYWMYQTTDLKIGLAENALLFPDDSAVANILDVWPLPGGKVFSVNWKPQQPWLPPDIRACKPGPWLQTLGMERYWQQKT